MTAMIELALFILVYLLIKLKFAVDNNINIFSLIYMGIWSQKMALVISARIKRVHICLCSRD